MYPVQQQTVELGMLPNGGSGGLGQLPSLPPVQPAFGQADAVQPNWWSGSGTGSTASGSNAGGGVVGLLGAIASGLSSLVNQLSGYVQNLFGESNAEGSPTQTIQNATFSSTGDPHLAESGTALDANGNPVSVNTKFDSMNSHADLISSQDFSGGYRVSTTVTQPNAQGITQNQSATVHTNANQDQVTLNDDGSYSIESDGTSIRLGLGQTTTLAGGEIVSRNQNGSLTVTEQNANGGIMSTTMDTNGTGGVDVNVAVQNASVGGDLPAGDAAGSGPAQPPAAPLPRPVMLRDQNTTYA
jgi:hypothetical protein